MEGLNSKNYGGMIYSKNEWVSPVVQVEPSLVLPYYVKGGLVQGRNLRDQQKLFLVGQSSCCCLFTRETPLLDPPGYRLVQRQDPVTDSFLESDRVESIPEVGPSQGQWGIEIGPGQQPTSASRDSISSSCSNHSSGPVEASSIDRASAGCAKAADRDRRAVV